MSDNLKVTREDLKKEIEKLYNKKCKVASINQDLGIKLINKIEEFIGKDFSSFEMDFAVDTLNEGYGDLSFKSFFKELNKIKNRK